MNRDGATARLAAPWLIEDAGDGLLFLADIERMPCSSAAVMGKLLPLTLCDRQEGG
jgi:hypothetical protein